MTASACHGFAEFPRSQTPGARRIHGHKRGSRARRLGRWVQLERRDSPLAEQGLPGNRCAASAHILRRRCRCDAQGDGLVRRSCRARGPFVWRNGDFRGRERWPKRGFSCLCLSLRERRGRDARRDQCTNSWPARTFAIKVQRRWLCVGGWRSLPSSFRSRHRSRPGSGHGGSPKADCSKNFWREAGKTGMEIHSVVVFDFRG